MGLLYLLLLLTSFERQGRPQDHIAAAKIMSMKNSFDALGDRTSDLLVLQRCAPIYNIIKKGKMIPLQARCGPEGGYRYTSTLP